MEKPPAWAWIVMIVAVVVLAAGIPWLSNRNAPDEAPEASVTDEPTTSSAAPQTAETTVAFIGDSYTAGVAASAGQGYVDVTCAALSLSCQNFGVGGTGYVNPGDGTQGPYIDRVAKATADAPAVVIVQGSFNDGGDNTVRAAASEVYSAIQAADPSAQIIVLGPIDTPLDADEDVARQNVQQAASEAGVTFLDAFEWVDVNNPALWEDIHPTTEGHAVLSSRLAVELEQLGVGAAP